jgi:hypothetical protein
LFTGTVALHPARKIRTAQPGSILNAGHLFCGLCFFTAFRVVVLIDTSTPASRFDKLSVGGIILFVAGDLGKRFSPLDQPVYPKA